MGLPGDNLDTTPACILEKFLYIGSKYSVNSENIINYGITHILSIGIEMPQLEVEMKIINLYIPCRDEFDEALRTVIEQSNEFIGQARHESGIVLIHCILGVSRAPSIAIGYLILVKRYSYEDAFQLVKSKREHMMPNDGFCRQLKMLSYNN